MDTESIIFLAFVICLMSGAFGFAFWFNWNQTHQTYLQFQKIAKKFGLKLTVEKKKDRLPKLSTLTGQYKDYSVVMSFYKEGYERSTRIYTYVEFEVENPGQKSFTIAREDLVGKVAKAFGASDMDIGDPEFDKIFIIKTNDVTYINRILTEKIRKDMLYAVSQTRVCSFSLEGKYLRFTVMDFMMKDKVRVLFERMLVTMHEMAEGMRR
ncbi:hypothetical protein KJ708_11690 [bacterium]|nr:hypothetical protein [bacterium]MBU1916494.1 hypothetical protein [bacterium]